MTLLSEDNMGRVDDSLTDVRQRQPNPVVNSLGNYRRSVIANAMFVYDNSGTWEYYAFTPGGGASIKCLLFMNGSVILMDPRTIYPADAGVTYQIDLAEDMRLNANVENGTQVITTTQSELEEGEQVYGTTPTAGVPVFGQYTIMQLIERTEGLAGATPEVELRSAISNSGVLSGELNYFGTLDEVAQDRRQVIMREADYTQAMRDAGDRLIVTQGGTELSWQIVGLFAEYIPA